MATVYGFAPIVTSAHFAAVGGTGTGATTAAIRNNTPACSNQVSQGSSNFLGLYYPAPNYAFHQNFYTFDTSTIPAGPGTIYLGLDASLIYAGGDTFEVRQVSSNANMIAGDSLASHTLLGTAVSAPTTTGRFYLPVDLSLLSRAAGTILMVSSQKQRLGTAGAGLQEGVHVTTTNTTASGAKAHLIEKITGPWTFVGISAPVEGTATTLTLTEPAGVAVGDLLVASISIRGTSTVTTVPSGWTLVAKSPTTPNTSTNTSATALAWMSYIVRGASAPSYAFTFGAAPSVALGRVAAYRGQAPTSPLDIAVGSSSATNIQSVSVTGLTTTTDDDLLVGMVAGGQEVMWHNVGTATDPAVTGDQGISNNSKPPVAAFQTRGNSETATGADTSLAVYDAVKRTAGATGNLVAFSFTAASHGLVMGAFKLAPPPSVADAWNVNDKTATITLSNSDKTATLTTGVSAGIRSTQARTNGTAGKYYAEFVVGSNNIGRVGIQTTSASVSSFAGSCHVFPNDGNVIINAINVGNIGTFSAGDVACVAWDTGAEKIWFRRNANAWHSGDPAAGTGSGADASFLTSVAHALWMMSASSGFALTTRTEAAEFTQAVPDGFKSWMGETLDAWNANDKSASVTLSNSDKTAVFSAAGGVRSTQARSNETAGQYYIELKIVAGTTTRFGVKLSTDTDLTSNANAFVVDLTTGDVYSNGSPVAGVNIPFVGVGDVLGMAWDTSLEAVWFRKNGGYWNENINSNPVTGSQFFYAGGLVNAAYNLFLAGSGSSHGGILRTTKADFEYTGPTGYKSWMGETLAPSDPNITVAVSGVSATGSAGMVVGGPVTPPKLDAWDKSLVTPAIVLSDDDRTATAPAGVSGTLWSTVKHQTGKWFGEIIFTGAAPGGVVGFFDDATDTGTVLTAAGSVQIWVDGVAVTTIPSVFPALVSGDKIGMAIDADAGKVWFRVNGGNWNNDSAQVPV